MKKSITYYNKLSILAFLIFLILVSLQFVWLVKAVRFQEKEIIHELKEVVADVALELNAIDHNTFHGDLGDLSLLPIEVMTKKVDEYLQSKGIQNKTYFAVFQDSVGGVFRTNKEELQKQFLESDIRACISCILSFSTVSKEVFAKMDNDESYSDSIRVLSTFQYYSPIKKLNASKGEILWLSLYQPNTLSIAIKSLIYLFAINLILLLLLLLLFSFLVKSLSKHKQLTKVKDDFFNSMTHEFKTPLSSIHLASKVLRKNTDIAKKEVYHNLIEKESKALEYQIDKLLELSLLDNKEIRLEKEPVDFCALIHEIPEKLKPMLDDKSGDLVIDCQLGNTFVKGDHYHLLNSFCNLVENSLKYSQEGVKINITASRNKNTVQVKIQDNGPGINEEHQANVFSRFYRGQKDNEYKAKGFGIGLSYVKNIIDAHDGTIELNTKKQEGTEFIISIPISKS